MGADGKRVPGRYVARDSGHASKRDDGQMLPPAVERNDQLEPRSGSPFDERLRFRARRSARPTSLRYPCVGDNHYTRTAGEVAARQSIFPNPCLRQNPPNSVETHEIPDPAPSDCCSRPGAPKGSRRESVGCSQTHGRGLGRCSEGPARAWDAGNPLAETAQAR
jgi:hypothetical protein